MERLAALFWLMWSFRIVKWCQSPTTGLLKRPFTNMPSRAPSAHFFRYHDRFRRDVTLTRVLVEQDCAASWRRMICQGPQMWLATALWSSPRGGSVFHDKTWRWYELLTPRLSPLGGSCMLFFDLAQAPRNVKYGLNCIAVRWWPRTGPRELRARCNQRQSRRAVGRPCRPRIFARLSRPCTGLCRVRHVGLDARFVVPTLGVPPRLAPATVCTWLRRSRSVGSGWVHVGDYDYDYDHDSSEWGHVGDGGSNIGDVRGRGIP